MTSPSRPPIPVCQFTVFEDSERQIACITGGQAVGSRQRHELAIVHVVRKNNERLARPCQGDFGMAPVDASPALCGQREIAQLAPDHNRSLGSHFARPVQGNVRQQGPTGLVESGSCN